MLSMCNIVKEKAIDQCYPQWDGCHGEYSGIDQVGWREGGSSDLPLIPLCGYVYLNTLGCSPEDMMPQTTSSGPRSGAVPE